MGMLHLQATTHTRTLRFNHSNGLQRSQDQLQQRKSIVLHLQHQYLHGWGEACPLPQFAGESYGDCLAQLDALKSIIYDNADIHNLNIASMIADQFPCAQFALQCALLDIIAQLHTQRIAEVINPDAGTTLQLQSLVDSTATINNNTTTRIIKCKVGALNIAQEQQRLAEIIKHNPQATLRLDANSAWNLEQSQAMCAALNEFPIEYIEDPCTDLDDCLRCAEQSSIPIAIDRCCHDMTHHQAILTSPISHVVLKPMAFGCIDKIQAFIQKCSAHNKAWTLSDFHNGNLARFHTWHLALALDPQAKITHGLHGQHLFANDYFALDYQQPLAPDSRPLMQAFHD